MAKDLLRIATAGSVDDGKSTLIGRLLYDSGGIYEDQLKAVSKASRNGLELALLTDGLRSEREQGITIDVAYRYFSTPQRKFIVADTPGHEQYTRNMATGASTADVALILVDARKGILPQTSRHASIAWLLGIREIVVVVNKMDLVEMREEVFTGIQSDFARVQAAMPGTHVYFIPAVATDGDNIARRSDRIGWFDGPCVLEYLEALSVEQSTDTRFRMAVQYVIRAEDYRGYTGQIASGSVRVGDELVALPSGKTVKVAGLPSFDGDEAEASAPMSVSVRLEEHLDLGRGDILAHPDHLPAMTRLFSARMVWMSEEPLQAHHRYQFKHLSQTVYGEIKDVRSRLDVVNLAEQPAESLRLNDIGIVTIETHRPIFCDRYRENRQTGSFVVIDPVSNLTVGAGMVEAVADRQDVVPRRLSAKSGVTAWFTGLSSAGKSTLSRAVYELLVARGHRVELLDGDEVRKHLSRGLGFSREDRDENIRRIGFVAEKLTRHGVIVLVSAISPYREIRDEMRERISSFLEVYVNAPIAVCEERDVKGLYRKARSGGLPRFTGVDDPYEPPLAPEVECHTDREDISQSSAKIVAAIEAALHAPVGGSSGD